VGLWNVFYNASRKLCELASETEARPDCGFGVTTSSTKLMLLSTLVSSNKAAHLGTYHSRFW